MMKCLSLLLIRTEFMHLKLSFLCLANSQKSVIKTYKKSHYWQLWRVLHIWTIGQHIWIQNKCLAYLNPKQLASISEFLLLISTFESPAFGQHFWIPNKWSAYLYALLLVSTSKSLIIGQNIWIPSIWQHNLNSILLLSIFKSLTIGQNIWIPNFCSAYLNPKTMACIP